MGRDVLGGFEHQVLLAVVRLGERGAYTVPLVELLNDAGGRSPAPAAVYTTLRRLEERGLLRSRVEPSEKGGRPRRVFSALPAGIEELRRSRRVLEHLWDGMSILEGGDA